MNLLIEVASDMSRRQTSSTDGPLYTSFSGFFLSLREIQSWHKFMHRKKSERVFCSFLSRFSPARLDYIFLTSWSSLKVSSWPFWRVKPRKRSSFWVKVPVLSQKMYST